MRFQGVRRLAAICGLVLLGSTVALFRSPELARAQAPTHASAHAPFSSLISKDEFRSLASELARKVNLFQATWKGDPNAEFFGGTTRDYLYWVMRQFRDVPDRAGALEKMKELRALELIDVREFIVGQSDVDVVSHQIHLDPLRFGVRRIDQIGPERFDPKTPEGQDELAQGYVPAEKIRLGRSGFIPWPQMGDGIGEIYDGKLTVHFSDPKTFAKTKYAQQNENHPVLLALRYLRLIAIDSFNRHGKAYPDEAVLLGFDPASREAVTRLIAEAANGEMLRPFLKMPRFVKWLNGSIQKAFLSYTNPTAARILFDRLGVGSLVSAYGEPIETYYQYLFQRYPEPEKYAKKFRELGIEDPGTVFVKAKAEFSDLKAFHGTKSPLAFRSILFQGTLPSQKEKVLAGAGLYVVAENNLSFAENWGGDPKRVVRLDVSPDARIIDITQGAGEALWKRYQAKHPGRDLDAFAEDLGIDIIRYPYSTTAYVVKNSGVLNHPQGHRVQLMPLRDLIQTAGQLREAAEFPPFFETLTLNRLSSDETEIVLKTIEKSPVASAELRNDLQFLRQAIGRPLSETDPIRLVPFFGSLIGHPKGELDRLGKELIPYAYTRDPNSFWKAIRNAISELESWQTFGHLLDVLDQVSQVPTDHRPPDLMLLLEAGRHHSRHFLSNPIPSLDLRTDRDFPEIDPASHWIAEALIDSGGDFGRRIIAEAFLPAIRKNSPQAFFKLQSRLKEKALNHYEAHLVPRLLQKSHPGLIQANGTYDQARILELRAAAEHRRVEALLATGSSATDAPSFEDFQRGLPPEPAMERPLSDNEATLAALRPVLSYFEFVSINGLTLSPEQIQEWNRRLSQSEYQDLKKFKWLENSQVTPPITRPSEFEREANERTQALVSKARDADKTLRMLEATGFAHLLSEKSRRYKDRPPQWLRSTWDGPRSRGRSASEAGLSRLYHHSESIQDFDSLTWSRPGHANVNARHIPEHTFSAYFHPDERRPWLSKEAASYLVEIIPDPDAREGYDFVFKKDSKDQPFVEWQTNRFTVLTPNSRHLAPEELDPRLRAPSLAGCVGQGIRSAVGGSP